MPSDLPHFDTTRDLVDYDYAELKQLAIDVIAHAESAEKTIWLQSALPVLRRRPLCKFREAVAPSSRLGEAIVELFLTSRFRSHLLAYLSVQEADDFASAKNGLSGQLGTMLRNMGRSADLRLRLRVGPFRSSICVRASMHLRAIYFLLCRCNRQFRSPCVTERIAIAWHRLAYTLQVKTIEAVVRVLAHRLAKRLSRGAKQWLADRIITTNAKRLIGELIPNSRRLSDADWEWIVRETVGFLSVRISSLLRVLPNHSIENHGLAKLAKVAIGVIAGREESCREDIPSKEYVVETIQLAYCWGITYPLVDNMIDSAHVDATEKSDIHELLVRLFSGTVASVDSTVLQCDSLLDELSGCLRAVIQIIGPERWKRCRRIMQWLHHSHQTDSERALSHLSGTVSASDWNDVMADTVLKAALVRWATMELCGLDVNAEALRQGLLAAPFNQLGDDMWDVVEDSRDNRVTPFTLFGSNQTLPNPYTLYFRYAAALANSMPRRNREAIFLGVTEVVRDVMASPSTPKHALETLADCIGGETGEQTQHFGDLVSSAPRVDADGILFAFEDCVLSLCR